MEDPNNIIYLCTECTDQRHKNYQKKYGKRKLGVGDHAKVCVEDNGKKEHMWFKVSQVLSNGAYISNCDSDPVLVENIKLDDIMGFAQKDIEEAFIDNVHLQVKL